MGLFTLLLNMILTFLRFVNYFKIWMFYLFLGHEVFNTSTNDKYSQSKTTDLTTVVSNLESNLNDETHSLGGIILNNKSYIFKWDNFFNKHKNDYVHY